MKTSRLSLVSLWIGMGALCMLHESAAEAGRGKRWRSPDHRIAPEEPLAVGDEHAPPPGSVQCERILTARVVALDQVIYYNRFGAFLPSGMMFALERDVVSIDGSPELTPGNVMLRPDKRPRPLVLRMNEGDCLRVTFTNLLADTRVDDEQPATRSASMMPQGLSLVDDIGSAGSNVGANPSSLAEPGETRVYTWHAPSRGSFLFQSAGAMTGGEGDGGQLSHGLFGAINVEPAGSVWYRSQVTAEEMAMATESLHAGGHRIVDYEARYPAGHPFEGLPVLEILDGQEIVHSDLNAIIAHIPPGTFPPVTVAAPGRSRDEPFREFTAVYHGQVPLVQGFELLERAFFASSIRDNFAINYGTGGIGAEVLSTGPKPFPPYRNAVGPVADCNDCKYEEFFLSSWAVGDPAMVIEREMVAPGEPFVSGEAIAALYPDDPSNVHHSYLNDHVKMRIVQGGVKEHHIHHLHAHQWLQTQNSDQSTILDSVSIGPGSALTTDIANNGSGNLNKTPGDAIFHCHFYPHFAQGMWSLWRVHDVFEDGTRRLPDAELEDGTPIPAIVPLPGRAMAPPPTADMPGYPFYIPGKVGHRPPHPPLDTIDDGGLPRHVVRGGTVLDGLRGAFDRIYETLDAVFLPEEGTPQEQAAMAFHAQRAHPSFTPEGEPAAFVTNGLPPVAGAPFADPCVDDQGNPVNQGNERIIKGASLQLDAIINKAGWHFPQTRMYAHWADVADFQSGARAPEPFFMRASSGDCVEYSFTNLIPNVYNQDDFQAFAPTDIVAQHIHLVKFDVTASDGAANGWNYEDGSFAPDEVIERIEAINAVGGLDPGNGGERMMLEPEPHPFFGVLGAQTTVQRWWLNPVLDLQGEDRTLRTVFSHDHFGPSTHQQAGLYAGLLVEPAGSTWRDPETGEQLGTRFDGGPTSWRADILTEDPEDSFREFAIEFQDFHLAYTADGEPVNPPGRVEIGLPFLLAPPRLPRFEAISADDPGTYSINYRNEPLALRVRDPDTNTQPEGLAGDLAHAYRSKVERADPAFNVQPDFYPPLTSDVRPGDPFTPLMRAYEGDKVQVRVLVGAHEEGHMFTIHGQQWRQEPSDPRSSRRNTQMMGISEHFELLLGPLQKLYGRGKKADYLYRTSASVDGQWNGNWGILREYKGWRDDLLRLPGNRDGRLPGGEHDEFLSHRKTCPQDAPVRRFRVAAVAAANVLPEGSLIYNRGAGLNDPTALVYVREEDLDEDGNLEPGRQMEPLILRANAGDCIRIELSNWLREDEPADLDGFNTFPMLVPFFNANQVRPSAHVGLHPQLVHFDPRRANGINVGLNPVSTVEPGDTIVYEWYAGTIEVEDDGALVATPVEFGAINLIPADPMKHSNKGLVGTMVIEPQGATWTYPDPGSRATADVEHDGGMFREFVLVFQDDINLRFADGGPVPNLAGEAEDPEDSAQKALNYRTEPMWTRLGYPPDLPLDATNDLIFRDALSIAGTGEIETPVFTAPRHMPVRFRVVKPQGHGRNEVIYIQGHQWRTQPGNPVSEIVGSQPGHGAAAHWNIIPLHGAGGVFGVPGDYLIRDGASFNFDGGIWGIFRVTE